MNKAVKVELDRLRAKSKGLLKTATVIDAARNKSSPLHSQFTWDAKKALDKNLQAEARDLIREYTIVVQLEEGKAVRTRHLVSLSTDRQAGGGYRALGDVFKDVDLAKTLLNDALAELAAFKAKYSRLVELAQVFSTIDEVLEKHSPPTKRKGKGGEKRAVT